jgi:hypothetical protein
MKNPPKYIVDAVERAKAQGFLKLDAIQTMAFARQLEVIETETYDIEHPELRARDFIPEDNSVPAGARTFTYRQWNRVTWAKLVSNYANDFPRVQSFGKEFTHKAETFGNSYGYSIQDLREAALLGLSLDTMGSQVAREGHEISLDNLAAFGIPQAGLSGFLNHPNVTTVTLTTGTWSTATTDQILEDLRMFAQSIVTRTLQTRQPNKILLDPASYGILQRPVGADYGDTIMSVFLRNNPYIKSIDPWVKLDTAAPDGGPLAVCYDMSPRTLKLKILMEFTQHPPQQENLDFKVLCESRYGGVVVYNPLAISYAHNHG